MPMCCQTKRLRRRLRACGHGSQRNVPKKRKKQTSCGRRTPAHTVPFSEITLWLESNWLGRRSRFVFGNRIHTHKHDTLNAFCCYSDGRSTPPATTTTKNEALEGKQSFGARFIDKESRIKQIEIKCTTNTTPRTSNLSSFWLFFSVFNFVHVDVEH